MRKAIYHMASKLSILHSVKKIFKKLTFVPPITFHTFIYTKVVWDSGLY